MKMLYWSMLVYRYEESPLRGVSLEGAMALYDLTNFELVSPHRVPVTSGRRWSSPPYHTHLCQKQQLSLESRLAALWTARARQAPVAHAHHKF